MKRSLRGLGPSNSVIGIFLVNVWRPGLIGQRTNDEQPWGEEATPPCWRNIFPRSRLAIADIASAVFVPYLKTRQVNITGTSLLWMADPPWSLLPKRSKNYLKNH